MTTSTQFARDVLNKIVDSIDIPASYYEAAVGRYESLGKWFHRPDSTVANDGPVVYPQGSLRLGTVVRPLDPESGYDLDLVCELREVEKDEGSQKNLKDRIGREVTAYANEHGMKKPEQGRRCWKLVYRGNPSFHIDSLPAIPEDSATKSQIAHAIRPEDGIGPEVAETAIAITDTKNPHYDTITADWNMSNPSGFAVWFESQMRAAAQSRMRELVESRIYAHVEDVPAYQWKTPLQIIVQILKRHRDVMFAEHPELKPISVIIATLAGRAYDSEADILDAFENVVERMPALINKAKPRIPNPSNPGEDFADKWDSARERAFFTWIERVRQDLRALRKGMRPDNLRDFLNQRFAVSTNQNWAAGVCALLATLPAQPRTVNIDDAPGQWRDA